MLGEIRHRRQALAASESRYRSIIHSMSEGVVTLDAQGRIVTVNESVARIAGLSLAQFKSALRSIRAGFCFMKMVGRCQ